jgi:hypothetical protein
VAQPTQHVAFGAVLDGVAEEDFNQLSVHPMPGCLTQALFCTLTQKGDRCDEIHRVSGVSRGIGPACPGAGVGGSAPRGVGPGSRLPRRLRPTTSANREDAAT